jgi:tRNA dimethylallyltransferase
MLQPPQKSALLIAGPTASGKTALALRLAAERNGVIINADSMQVYAELRILTARPTPEEEARVPHRLFGHVSGGEDYSVAHWLADATRELHEAWSMRRLPIICGGTGLYFSALQQGFADVPAILPSIREKWRGFAGDLHAELARRDAAMASRLQPQDRQRITRALEVVEQTGRSLLQWQEEAGQLSVLRGVDVERLFVDVERKALYARAEARLDAMVAGGALDEVRLLPAFPPSRPLMKAIGVQEIQLHLRGALSLEEALVRAKAATRHYIKRQLTWWRPRLSDWSIYK